LIASPFLAVPFLCSLIRSLHQTNIEKEML
jgi:hypothetical protein